MFGKFFKSDSVKTAAVLMGQAGIIVAAARYSVEVDDEQARKKETELREQGFDTVRSLRIEDSLPFLASPRLRTEVRVIESERQPFPK